MRRRTFLALAGTGLAAATAGCAGIGGDGDSETNAAETETKTNPDTPTSARTTNAPETIPAAPMTMDGETMAPRTVTAATTGGNGGGSGSVSGMVTSVPDGLKITKQWFFRKQFATGVRGILKNVSGSAFEYVEIRAAFYNANGKRIDTGIDHVTDLAPGEKWPFEVRYRGSRDSSRIVRYTLVVDTSPI